MPWRSARPGWLCPLRSSPLRSQASAAANVLMAFGAIGSLVTGGLSTLFGNLRVALLAVSPFYVLGAVLVMVACRTYVSDVAVVVAEARGRSEALDV
jgi:hypothetical protein